LDLCRLKSQVEPFQFSSSKLLQQKTRAFWCFLVSQAVWCLRKPIFSVSQRTGPRWTRAGPSVHEPWCGPGSLVPGSPSSLACTAGTAGTALSSLSWYIPSRKSSCEVRLKMGLQRYPQQLQFAENDDIW
jgi:hypothetical protein